MAQLTHLSQRDVETIHDASLRVLENTGVKMNHEEGEDLLLGAGAKRDAEGRILIPRKLVQESLEKAQSSTQRLMRLHDRDGTRSIDIRMGHTYFGPGSDALYNVDLAEWTRRRSRLSDIQRNVTLADALPGFDFVMSMALPEEVEGAKLYATVFAEVVKFTTKPVITTCTSLEDLQQIHRIASIVAGGEDRLRERPFFVAYLEPISPLIMDRSGTDRLLYCAEHGIPILYAAGANCGSGAPITPEGGVVQGSAESLGGLVVALLKNEDLQFVYGANTSAMDMRSMIVSYGDPTWFRTTAMYADLGRFYNLPSWGTAGSSDSFEIDAQAALEAYEGISLAVMSGTTLAHDVAYLAHGELYDPRMLILTDMMIGRVRHLQRAVDVSEEALAVSVIDEVARSGELYLAHPHTARWFRESLWLPPRYFNRKHIAHAADEPFPELLAREVHELLDSHRPVPLDPAKEQQIQEFLESLPSFPSGTSSSP